MEWWSMRAFPLGHYWAFFESVHQNFARLSSFIFLRTFAQSTTFICAKIIMLFAKIRAARLNKTKKAKVDLIKVE